MKTIRMLAPCFALLPLLGAGCKQADAAKKKGGEPPPAAGLVEPAPPPPAAGLVAPAPPPPAAGLVAPGDLAGRADPGTAPREAPGTAPAEGWSTAPAAAPAPAPVAPAAAPVPAGEAARVLPCAVSPRDMQPLAPDPEAGDFTLQEALAGLEGAGPLLAEIETSLGTIRCTLAEDKAPRGVANFVGLARGLRPWWDPCARQWVRAPYYDGLTWHRVIPRFMAQGGDILGIGMGGPGYEWPNEQHPDLRHDRPGTLAYANAGRDTNGAQFYITVGPRPQLDGGYVVFGYCENVDVVEAIVAVPRDANDRPLRPVLMRRVTIRRGAP